MDVPLPILNDVEIRVLGALIEKSKATPEYYPMTLHALTAACNQKTSRYPVVQYDEETVVMALNNLKRIGLTSTATGGTNRVTKYKHNIAIVFPINLADVAILCLLFLRGPQTPGELNTNSGRLYEFESIEEVQTVLDKLSHNELPFVKQLPRRAGQKEMRYIHLFTDSTNWEIETSPEEPARKSVSELEARLATVEQELSEVKEKLGKLLKELNG